MFSSLAWSALGRQGQERGLLVGRGASGVCSESFWQGVLRHMPAVGEHLPLTPGKPRSRKDMVRKGQGFLLPSLRV